ncbi:multicopper oxidase family protein [Agromyces sp. ZXT2-3]|uniref:multicopper oxidase family protein n=1 Tax=Agromyces sp. ZXT2-3 TaxID=3461152 RepID=UPI0040552731
MPSRRDLLRCGVVGVAVVTALGAGALAWSSTLLGEYSVMDMGGGRGDAAHAHGDGTSGGGASGAAATGAGETARGEVDVTGLVADPARRADVQVDLVARAQVIDIPGGRAVEGYTVNGTSPGPEIRARQGDLVEVTLENESVPAGATLHWHGIDVPNAADGVAGITQDAVPVGGRFTYRFVAEDAGTYWYHSHQVSHDQVVRGLLGAIVIDPADPADAASADHDITALLHVYGGQHTLNGSTHDERVPAEPGEVVRVRVINTDSGTAAVWSTEPVRVVAIDGREVNRPTDVDDRRILIPAGGRADVAVTAPPDGSVVRLRTGGARSVLIGDPSAPAPSVPQPSETLDLLDYGSPEPGAVAFDATAPDRSYEYAIGRRPGLIDGRPGYFWTINGRMFPDVPMFEVAEGDVVAMRIRNDSGEVHPMHLHGHHVVVLARDGVAASGSPWIVDSLDVRPGEHYDIAFLADNPGIWSDHCHTLQHAVDGLIAHVMYEGVTTPFTIGPESGNRPD